MSKFIWYDLMTPDMKASSQFYADVVGWSIKDSGMPGMDYAILSANGVDVGGIMPVPPSAQAMPPCWNGYVYSADVDKDEKRATSLGGSVFQEAMDIPGVGRFAVIADPHGAPFIIFKPNSTEQPKPIDDRMPGHAGWRELQSGDMEKAWPFYEKMFGWTISQDMPMGAMGSYRIFDCGPGQQGGMMSKMKEDPSPPHWNYYFSVPSLAAAITKAKARGATFFMDPMPVPGGGFATNGLDPQEAAFSLFSPNA